MIRLKRCLTLSLIFMLLLVAVAWAAAQEGLPGPAPVRTERSWPSPFALGTDSRVASTAQCVTENCTFLPIVEASPPWINTGNRSEVLAAYRQKYLVVGTIDPQWTGSHNACDPGDVSAELKAAILRRINYFRGMAGVPAQISFNSEYNRKAQAAALMISVNRQSSLDPPPSWKCWSQDGADGSANSSSQVGGFGVDAIKGWMRDKGASNAGVENRRWLLYPQTKQMGTGNVPAGDGNIYGAALWVKDANEGGPRPETRQPYVAWPPPGYTPYPVVFARWSFTYPDAFFDQAAVTMTQNGAPVPVSVAAPANDTWENTLVWIPFGLADSADWPRPAGDTVYHVTISNVKIGLELHSFSYDVVIFDPDA